MPTYAILGATGMVGGAILTVLAKDESVHVRCFVRSSKKLYKQKPILESNNRITAFEGSVGDIQTLAECIEPCTAVFSCIAPTANTPGCSTSLDAAHSVVAAMAHNRFKQNTTSLPKIIMLSSSTINDHLSREISQTFRWILHTGLRFVYDDLERAEAYYRLHGSWMTVVFMQPGGLVEQEAVGHIVNTEKQHTFLPVPDLANACIEVAEKGTEKWDWKNVSVLAKGKTNFAPDALKNVAVGWVWSAFPWLYFACEKAGLW